MPTGLVGLVGIWVSILNQEYRLLLLGKMVVGSRKAGLASLFWVLTMMDHDGVRIAYTYCYTFG